MDLLNINNLRIEFPSRHGTVVAVDQVTLRVGPGEVLGVVGESGAGKSTIGNAVIGLLEPPGEMTGGHVYLKSEQIDTLGPEAKRKIRGRRIGMIFQDPLTSLDPLQTIEQQLVETIEQHLKLGEKKAKARAIDLLRQVGIPDPEVRIQNYPHQFSGGMRQRVVIALALCAEPEVIIASYHGLPKRYLLNGDPYHCQCQKTTRLLRDRLGWEPERIATTFQSRFGPEEWLQP